MTKNTPSQKIALLILCFILFEGGIFAYTATTYITPFYPRFFDQIQYLRESYLAYQEMQLNGLWSAIYGSLSNQVAQGVWHDFAALLSMSVFGPHRISALLVNFIWLIFLQLALFFVTLSATRNNSVAWLSFLMPLLIQGIWRPDVGGALYDFRLDHLAMCMMGLTIISCLKTEGFTNRKWSIIFGLLVSLTITGRFLTSVYFGLIYALLFGVLLFNSDRKTRVGNLVLSAFAAIPLVAIFFTHNWERIYNYYLVNHMVGTEKIARASGLNSFETFQYISINGLYTFQGPIFFILFILILLVYFFSDRRSKQTELKEIFFSPLFSWWRIVGFIFFISPMIVLSFESEAQNAVLSILTPGIVIFLLSLIIPFYLGMKSKSGTGTKTLLLLMTVFSLFNFTYTNLKFSEFKEFASNANKVNQIADFIYQYSIKYDSNVKIATNRVVEFLDANIQRMVIYERHGKWLPLEGTLPAGLIEVPNDEIYERLKNSNLAFSIEGPAITRGFPSELQMQSLQREFTKIYHDNFKALNSINIFDKQVTVYERLEK
jgi:hypothetical protein